MGVTKRPDPFYKSKDWHRIRAIVRRRSGGVCEIDGCFAPAVVCDHIISRRQGGVDDPSNCRDLCRMHDNQAKEDARGQRRSGGKLTVVGCDADGRPLDPSHHWARCRHTRG